jgi:uncharacterized Zn finger protein
MGVSYNADENKIYWECKNCGYTNNKGTVSELNESYQECKNCGEMHDIDVCILVRQLK